MDGLELLKGQDRAAMFLRSGIDNHCLNHAYLFYGPAGVGKMTAAIAFATEIIEKEDPAAQIFLSEKAHPDLLVIERQPEKTRLGKEQVSQSLQAWLALKPYRAKHRLVIIRDAHLMTPEAGNALLKTLEEPPQYAIIILISDEGLVMETIASRCQAVRFQAVSERDIADILINQGTDMEQALNCARLSQGSVAAALEFTQETGLTGKWEQARYYLKEIANGNMGVLFEAAEAIEKAPHLLSHMLSTILRDIYVFRATKNPDLLLVGEHQDLAESLPDVPLDRIGTALNRLQALQKQLRYNVNPLTLGVNMTYAIRAVFGE